MRRTELLFQITMKCETGKIALAWMSLKKSPIRQTQSTPKSTYNTFLIPMLQIRGDVDSRHTHPLHIHS